MAIYAISDLHLSKATDKPMDVFGPMWEDYENRIQKGFQKLKDEDITIIPGDISWAMSLREALLDFKFIDELPGKKLISKGNHDYYFTTLSKMNSFFKENNFNTINILQNNYFLAEDILICGTRGWDITGTTKEDKKLLEREAIRLSLSIESAKKDYPDKEIHVFLHFPPILLQNKNNIILDTLCKYGIKYCYFGHLHSQGIENAFIGEYNNVIFTLISAHFRAF